MNEEDKGSKFLEKTPVVEKELAKTTVMMPVGIIHPLKDELMTARVSDWSRLKRLLKRVENPPKDFTVWWSLLFGVSATGFVGAISLYYTIGLPPWITWTVIGASALLCLIGGFFVIRDRDRKTKLDQDVDDIWHEVANIDAALEPTVPHAEDTGSQ